MRTEPRSSTARTLRKNGSPAAPAREGGKLPKGGPRKATATVEQYMTPSPHMIGKDQTLATAHAMMREHEIRHLPVREGGRLVGVVSQRDLHLVETLKDVNPSTVTVEEAMTPDPLTVQPSATLEEVARLMLAHRTGSVLVVENERVVGVFTTVDALAALVDVLDRRPAHRPQPKAQAARPTPARRAPARTGRGKTGARR